MPQTEQKTYSEGAERAARAIASGGKKPDGYKLLCRVFNRLNQQPGLYPGVAEAINIAGGILEKFGQPTILEDHGAENSDLTYDASH